MRKLAILIISSMILFELGLQLYTRPKSWVIPLSKNRLNSIPSS